MNNANSNNTCILYFTTGNRGAKSFSPKKKKSNAIQRLLFSKTLKEIQKSNLNYQISSGAEYGSNTLQALNFAVADIFLTGFKQVIIVGDDTPELSASHIKKAEQHLQASKLSIGPAKDGGTYLIAFGKSDFEAGILKNLTWHSEAFLDQLLANCALAHSDFELLPVLRDIDSTLDLFAFIATNKFNSFVVVLKNLLFSVERFGKQTLCSLTIFFKNCIDRGPPRLIFN